MPPIFRKILLINAVDQSYRERYEWEKSLKLLCGTSFMLNVAYIYLAMM